LISEGNLGVGDDHVLYFRTYGNPTGLPALFLHGGPGAGCFPNHARFFDPAAYRIVLFDQRGCGSSTPKGELNCNDTPHLVADIEAIRVHLGINKWRCIMGGSWGVALALSYARMHHGVVEALILRGVCLMRPPEIDYLFGDGGEASRLNPESWERFASAVGIKLPHDVQGLQGGGRRVLHAYYDRLMSSDAEIRMRAAHGFRSWEGSMFSFGRSKIVVNESLRSGMLAWDGSSWALDSQHPTQPSKQASRENEILVDDILDNLRRRSIVADDKFPVEPASKTTRRGHNSSSNAGPTFNVSSTVVPAQAILTAHYSLNNGFLENTDILGPNGVGENLSSVKCIAVQGGLDFITPPRTALELHDAWPEMELRLVLNCGHSMYDPGITSELVQATDSLRDI
jgi:proline iminopeptidase